MGRIYECDNGNKDIEFNVYDRLNGKANILISGTIDYETLKKLIVLLCPKKVIKW